jgi:hypothetical protein
MVRNLIKALLLANFLLLAWGRWIVAPDAVDATSFGNTTVPQLELIARPDRTDVASTPGDARCFRLGPFSSADAAAVVDTRLSARGLLVNRSSELGKVWVGHWVQILDLPSEEVARQVVKKLVSGGISDAYIFSREPTVDISLGVFRGRQGADDVIRVARKLGYSSVSTDRFRDGIEHWVEIELSADAPPDLADLRIGQADSGQAQIVRIEEQSCQPAEINVQDSNISDIGNSDNANDSLELRAGENGSSAPSALPE